MLGVFFRKKHKALVAIELVLIVLNALFFNQPILGAVLLFFYLYSTGTLVGPAVLPEQKRWMQTSVGSITVISTLSILGSILYYIGPVFQGSFLTLVVVVGLAASLFGSHGETERSELKQFSPKILGAVSALVLALAAWWSAILSLSITEPVRTPWELLDPVAILAVGTAIGILAAVFAGATHRKLAVALTCATFFSMTALAVVAYPIGFGFDPFIHRTTVAYIAEFGTITPKPLYYIGQYALELISVHAFALPLQLTDRLLVPLLASILIPLSAAIGFLNILKTKALPALLSVFLLPLSAFIATTPQSLAYIFTIALLFLSLPRLLHQKTAPPLLVLFIVASAAVITHPLAGIPAAIYFALVSVAGFTNVNSKVRVFGVAALSVVGAISLPAVFVVQAQQSGLDINLALNQIINLEKLGLSGFLSNRFSSTFDGLYLVIENLLWILFALALVGAWFIKKHKANPYLQLPLIAAILWIINYWLLSTTLEFRFLIEYERQNYALRLLTLTAIFLIPHVGIAISGITDFLKSRPRALLAGWLVLITLLATANVYGAYPRHDNYAKSAGFNVSETDFDAVYAIEADAETDEFVVLANQAVSAAALEAFGFKKYYNDDIFYYPIPTGGELYQIYLEMADEAPTRERSIQAMDLAGVDTAYFAVNDYWWRSDVIIERAKQEADEWFSVGEGAVTVFKFER